MRIQPPQLYRPGKEEEMDEEEQKETAGEGEKDMTDEWGCTGQKEETWQPQRAERGSGKGSPGMDGLRDTQTKVLWYLLSSVEVERGESENVITREKGQWSYKEPHVKSKEALTFSLQDRFQAWYDITVSPQVFAWGTKTGPV